jgi:hypothetical protein
LGLRTTIEQAIVTALAPLQELGLYVVDCPEDSVKTGEIFDRGTASVGYIAEQAQAPKSVRVEGSPITQTHVLQFEVHLELQDEKHRLAADCVDRVEELVAGLVPPGYRYPLYLIRAGFLRLDADSIWHYAVIFGYQTPIQTHLKEAA